MAKAKTPTTTIERIREVSPRYADLLEKNAELTARHEAVLAEIRPLSEQERRHNISWISQAPKPQPKPKHRHAGAVALVGDLLSPQPKDELTPQPLPPAFPGEQRLRELGAESEAVSEAIRLLGPELKKARREFSTTVATQRKAEYQAHAEAVTDAARKLGDAIQKHHAFIDEQRRGGIAYQAYRPLNLERFGNLNEPGSPLMQTILDAIELGHYAGPIPTWQSVDILSLQGGNL